ncbi:MAG: HesA/MoeB/ThiF family protein, partial [Planctomycetaceae bacterium]
DQDRLQRAKVLIVGAGALGNEIAKNLALLGVGNVFIADRDRVENSNLSRSILYRESDNGRSKAEAAAAAMRAVYPGMTVQPFHGNVVYDLGLGVYRWADVVLAGLDNREARLSINRNCFRLGRPWIDGAIEQIQGVARVFIPDGPCYECTMSEIDWQLLQRRRSCNLLSRQDMEHGRTPTTPTISSIIAGVQCQEAVKLLHGLETLRGEGWIYEGLSGDSWRAAYQRKDDCYSHDPLDEVIPLDAGARDLTVRQLIDEARRLLGDEVQIELARDVLETLRCPKCGAEETLFASLGRVTADKAFCPNCDGVRREVVTFFRLSGTEPFAERTLAEIGVPEFDLLIARTAERSVGLELAADAPVVLGPLAGTEEALEWL